MIMILNILIVLAVLTVVASLVLGGINMRKAGEEARLKANKLMRLRIIAQLSAVAFLVILVVVRSKSQGG